MTQDSQPKHGVCGEDAQADSTSPHAGVSATAHGLGGGGAGAVHHWVMSPSVQPAAWSAPVCTLAHWPHLTGLP